MFGKWYYFCYLCNAKANTAMRSYKVIEVIRLLEADGWILVATKGDHRQYKHPTKKGNVTIRGHNNEVLSQFLLNLDSAAL